MFSDRLPPGNRRRPPGPRWVPPGGRAVGVPSQKAGI